MGLPPGWRISDLPAGYTSPVSLITAIGVDTTSAAYNPHANSIQVLPAFSDGNTKCDVIVLNDDGTGTFVQVAEFLGVSLFKESLYVGELDQQITLGGRNIKVTVQNFSGGGTVAISIARLN
jgi:hypothetical protein